MRNLTITNYDDAIAVKPSKLNRKIATCSENIYAENITVYFGVGMTIGTVPPNPDVNCVRNVTFKNIDFNYPLKAIYIKTNPGIGKGIIENILYEDIKIKDPVWWNIYIGPQQ